jgi:hypothetical protein
MTPEWERVVPFLGNARRHPSATLRRTGIQVSLLAVFFSLAIIENTKAQTLYRQERACSDACRQRARARAEFYPSDSSRNNAFQAAPRPPVASGSYGAMLEGRNPASSAGL